jgi:DNA (cytosine-5)-methyltransferase 1
VNALSPISVPYDQELIVDLFAGGGGTSEGLEWGLGRPVDIAINHDPIAIAMHEANHPTTRHYITGVFEVDPREATRGRPVGLLWLSPDCRDHSKAKGDAPNRDKVSRSLAWVGLRWAGLVRPRIIMLENVEEWEGWGPLTRSGRRCKRRAGETFRQWVQQLQDLGYAVEWRQLRACDYGAPTIRKRLFLIARCDGQPIVWPEPTHGPGRALPYRTAAEIIDWSIPCPSIFGRKRPLADRTMARIARGVWRYVINAADPFIVPVTHGGDARVHSIHAPVRTITCANRCELALVTPFFAGVGGRAAQSRPRAGDEPLGTTTAKADVGLVAAFLAQHNTGMVGHDARSPVSTIVGKGSTQGLVAAFLSHQYTSNTRGGSGDPRDPLKTVTAGGQHHALVHAFLMKYFGTAVGQDLRDPAHTLTTKPRLGLVTVRGEEYAIADIGMRMLTPRELFRAQGFRDDYVIDPIAPRVVRGREVMGRLTIEEQIGRCGNSVCPPVAAALARANYQPASAAAVAA